MGFLSDKVKQEFVARVRAHPYLANFVKQHEIDYKVLVDNYYVLVRFMKEFVDCEANQESKNDECQQTMKNYQLGLIFREGHIYEVVEDCWHGRQHKQELDVLERRYGKFLELRTIAGVSSDNQLKDVVISPVRMMLIKKYYQNKYTKGFYLQGATGLGKSYFLGALICALNKKQNKQAVFVNANALVSLFKKKLGQKQNNILAIMSFLKKCDYLAIDDIGSEHVSSWVRDEIWYNIINARLDNKKVTYFSSNFSFERLVKIYAETKEIKDYDIRLIKAQRLVRRISDLADVVEFDESEDYKNFLAKK